MNKILPIFFIIIFFVTPVSSDEKFKLIEISKKLTEPWGMTFVDDNNLLITEKTGGIIRVDMKTGEKIHPRTAGKLCEENAIYLGKDKVFWLTPDFCKHKGLERIDGLMFRYMLPMSKSAKKHFKKSTVDWSLNYPKDKDIKFWRQVDKGKYEELDTWPSFSFSEMNYNKPSSNVTLDKFMN